ncbi:MAG TPA: 4Fe-4S dicluster domain-containing protein [Chloroflexia bacterium]|nr:4Fe-4S dicluster domain-containing protein [Chloroflexia bacterium]
MTQSADGAFIPISDLAQRDRTRRPKGFFTDTSVCIGCKACEVACKQWNALPSDGYEYTGFSYDNTQHLSGSTWRHVAFVERPGAGHAGAQSNWLMASDVCKHCTHAGCLQACPTGAIIRTEFNTVVIQEDVCNGCGYCVPACPFGVVELAALPVPAVVQGPDSLSGQVAGPLAHKCTLCYDRVVDGIEPACAKACPTDSIQFGDIDELRARATRRVADLHAKGIPEAYLYGAQEGDPGTSGGIGPLNAFFLLLDSPETYNLPDRPQLPQNNVLPGYVATALTALALGLGAALAFRRR